MHLLRSGFRALALLLMTLAMTSPTRAEVVPIDWDAAGRFQHRQDIAPGKFGEVCGKLAKGQSVRWRFQADAPLNFNIHYHEDKKVEYPARQDGVRESQGTLPVPLDQDYCWMWVNKSGVVISLQVQLSR